jgi:hypothetical protein
MFRHKIARPAIREDESQQQKRIYAYDNPDASEMTRMLVRDYKKRSSEEDKGGSASSAASSP